MADLHRGSTHGNRDGSTVRLLVSSTGTGTTKLLRLAAAGIRDEEGAIVLEKDLLELVLGGLVDKLLVVRQDALGDGLADGVDARGVATTRHAHTDVDVGEALSAEQQNGLPHLEAQNLGLDKVQGRAVDADRAVAFLNVGDRCCGFLAAVGLHGV